MSQALPRRARRGEPGIVRSLVVPQLVPPRIGAARLDEPVLTLVLCWAGARLGDWQRTADAASQLPEALPTPRKRRPR